MTDTLLPCRILLVDDEENILRSITRLLIEEDAVTVETALSGEEALKLLDQYRDVAVILSDQRMPGMSGAEFLQQAREAAPDAVRMVLTGYADVATTIDAINKGGASRYITKPWDDEMLLRTLQEGVAQYRMRQENRRLSLLVEQQNAELAEWNTNLKKRVMDQTVTIRKRNEELSASNGQIEKAFQQTILAFSRLVELHGTRLKDHARNVTELVVNCATTLGWSGDKVEVLRIAALLHDIGAIGMDPNLIDSTGTVMTRDQFQSYRQHPVRGQAALDAVEELREAALQIRHHHERFDGKGFPDGLSGIEIPPGARIIAFADFVDRELGGVRTASALQAVLSLCKSKLGSLLDPELYEPMEGHILNLYQAAPERHKEQTEREYQPKDLHDGMVITRNLYSGTGILLLTAGSVLDSSKITAILRYYRIDPPQGGIMALEPIAG
ncbi:HD domain-containing phosphohydrolase [Geomesophilobacter sediminis]|uniref:Response regulator n=1 Tax=Geomesophilobacter sediminis TaxID=2798584 RepID=A0A8J7SCF6_9BACT|nr:HD domain-containing phosphohydrolase [Geomesophilobacter sediminis]MBJ6727154.1 response regulator [Geomesophilobacter sediminis]